MTSEPSQGIAVAVTRTGGTVTTAVTKVGPSAHLIAATLTRTGGTVTAAITKITGGVVRQIAVSTTRTGGTVTAAVGVALRLSAWDNTGLDVEFSALVVISGTLNLYADADRGGTDTPIEGELGVGPDDTALSRIRWDTGTNRLILNDNDSPGSLNLGNFFNTGGVGNDLTIYVTNVDGTNSFPVSSHLLSSAPNVVRFQNLPAALVTVLDNVSVGDRFIFSAARREVVARAVAVSLTRTGGTVAAAVTKVAPICPIR